MSVFKRRPRVAVLYHYLHPDDVVSARHLGDFCADLAARGWDVEAWPCNRSCHHPEVEYPPREQWQSVSIHRVWRPRFRQASAKGRILNSAWMLAAWSALGLRRHMRPDVVVIGTDPVLSVLVAPVLKRLRPSVRIAHWAFDLYPECALAEGMLREDTVFLRLLQRPIRRAYAACDLIADLGSCMRARLSRYGHSARTATLVPWALVEPPTVETPDPEVRRELFGDAKLGLLYSGNLGRAHCIHEFLELARRLRTASVRFAFGVRGHRADELRSSVGPDDANVTMTGFVPENALAHRLAAADIHLVSLRPEWTGLVLPSKFFGSLATGRPVLFAGSRDCAIARWIDEHQVGWVLDASSLDEVAEQLRALQQQPASLAELQQHCQRVYHAHFSRRRVMDAWHEELLALLPRSQSEKNGRQTTETRKHRDFTEKTMNSPAFSF